MARLRFRLLPALLTLAIPLLLAAGSPARGEAEIVAVRASADARPTAADWESAPRLRVGSVRAPWLATDEGEVASRTLVPDLRVLAAGGRLHVRVEVAEPPGLGMGLSLMLAPDRPSDGAGAVEPVASAAGAVALAFAPQDVQNPRFVARGPRGVGRAFYRLEGRADVSRGSSWSAEVSVPFADLGVEEASTPIACAVVVRTRLPGVVAWAPPTAAFAGPSDGSWFRLSPDAGDWPKAPALDEAEADRLRTEREEEDAADAQRVFLWQGFQLTDTLPPVLLLEAAGHARVKPLEAPRAVIRKAVDEILVASLDRILELRPDLAFAHVRKGHVYAQLGLDQEALHAFQSAREVVPELPEAVAGEWLEVLGPALVRGGVGEATDYAAARRDAAHVPEDGSTFAKDGAALGRALLEHLSGDFPAASAALDRLAARYPTQPAIVLQSERTRRALHDWPLEQQRRAREEAQGDLPRVGLSTTKGDVVLELFEDDTPNTVKNFVWLVEKGLYAEQALDPVVPFLGWVVGDVAEGPGYAIPAEGPARPKGRRRLFRGTVAMVSADPDAVRSAFLVTTGTALHLDAGFVAFGRVVAGQDVVEAMTAGDRILGARVIRKRPGTEYRPVTVKGDLAPDPR